jgi:hypothetical protein
MRYDAVIQMYDMLDQVVISAVIRASDDARPLGEDLIVTRSTTIAGVGETDPIAWLLRGLVALTD